MLTILSHGFLQICANTVMVCAPKCLWMKPHTHTHKTQLPFKDEKLPKLSQNSNQISLHNFCSFRTSSSFFLEITI